MSTFKTCAIHTNQTLTHYCLGEYAPICVQCIETVHAGHSTQALKDYCDSVIKSEEWKSLINEEYIKTQKSKISAIITKRKEVAATAEEFFKNIQLCLDYWVNEAENIKAQYKKSQSHTIKLKKLYEQNDNLQFVLRYQKLHEINECNLLKEGEPDSSIKDLNHKLFEFEKYVRDLIVCSNPTNSIKFSAKNYDSLPNTECDENTNGVFSDEVMQLIELSQKFEKNLDYSLSLEYLLKAKEKIELSQTDVRTSPQYFHLLNQISYATFRMGNIEKSIECVKPITDESIIQSSNCEEIKAESYRLLGLYHLNKGDNEESLKYLTKAISLCKVDSVESIEPNIRAGISNIRLENIGGAELYLNKAIELCNLCAQESSSKAYNLNLLGTAYREMKQLDKCIDFHNQAYDLLLSYFGTQENTDIAITLKNIGHALFEKDTKCESNDALNNLNNGLDILRRVSNGFNIEVVDFNYLIGQVYLKRMNYQKAFEFCNNALKMIKDILKIETMLLADIEQTVGVINYKLKRYDKAIGNCTASIDIRKRLKNKETSSIAYCYHIIGLSHLEIERLDDATVNITMSYDIYNKLCGESSNEVASEMLVLGQILISQKKYNDALNILLKSLNIKKKINETSKDVAEVCDQIAISYHMISKYSTALQYFNKSFIIKQVRFAGQDPTICLHNILGRAISHHERGDYDEAFDLYKKAISIHEDMVRCQTVDQAMLYNNMGCLLRATGKPDEALMYIQKALKILNELAPITLYVANCFENLGNVHFEKKDLNICYSYWNQAMELRSKIAGDKSIEIAQSYVNLSSYYKATKLYDKAEVYLLKSLNIYQCSYKSSKHPDIGYVYFCLAMLKKEMGDNMSSFEFLSGAKEMYNGYENEKPEICKQIYGCISGYYSNSKKYTDACATLESLVEKCYDVNTKCKADIEEISNIYQSISCICNKTKNYNKAIIFLTKSYDLINKEYGELNYLSAKCVYFLAKEYMLLPNYALAKECLIKAKKVFTHIYGKDSSYCIKIEQNMAECNHVLTD